MTDIACPAIANPDSVARRRTRAVDSRLSDWLAPDGWRHRRFDWAHPAPRGRILILGGRADIIEKYFETIAHLHDRGWSVTAFDWRGQGGSGRIAADPHAGHAVGFDRWAADLGAFWRAWVREGGVGPTALLGHSMGGHLALRALLDGGIDPAALVLVAPMIGIRTPLPSTVGSALGRALAWLMTRTGDPARPMWRVRPDIASTGHRQRLLTHSVDRYEDEAFWYGRDPSLLLGPPTWAWLLEAFVACAQLRADPRLASVQVPILMLLAETDGLVDAAAAARVAGVLPDCELVRFGAESAHEILREDDAVRLRAYAAIDDFLDRKAAAA